MGLVTPGERFDSGAVFARATPVLTFGPEVGVARSTRGEGPLPIRPRLDTPTPGPVTTSRVAPRRTLPVVPRIVRRTFVDGNRALLRPMGRAARAAREGSMGAVLLLAMALAAFGALAGTGMRSLGLERIAGVASALQARDFDADSVGVERVLARVPPPARVERAEEPRVEAPAEPPAEAPAARPVPTPMAAAPAPQAGKRAAPHAAARPLAPRHPRHSLHSSVRHHRRRSHP